MPNMERRYFLSISAIGAISAGHILKSATTAGLNHSTPQLEDFRKLIGARRCHFLALEKALDEAGTAAAQSYINLGYRPAGVSPFWLAGAGTALLPLQLAHQTEGVLDTQILVFNRSSAGNWSSCGALSGFHLEAVAAARVELQASPFDSSELRKLLLPQSGKGMPFLKGWAHPTESGYLGLSVQITAGQTTVEAAIVQAGKTIWHQVFSSRHALQCASGLLA